MNTILDANAKTVGAFMLIRTCWSANEQGANVQPQIVHSFSEKFGAMLGKIIPS